MKNPFYLAVEKDENPPDKDQAAFLAAENYLASDPSVAEVEERKIRLSHKDLADDAVWGRVKARLEAANKAAAREARHGSSKAGA